MKYENTVMFTLIGLFLLTFAIVVVQSYELKQKDEMLKTLNDQLLTYKVEETFNTIQESGDYKIISDDGLRIEHELTPNIIEVFP